MNPDNQCPICYDPISKKVITCPNGHSYCEKHVLERARAMVKEGNLEPFACESNALNCFVCRVKTKEANFDNFSPQFVNLMNLTLCVEITRVLQKKLGGSPGLGLEVLKDLQDMNGRSKRRISLNFERSEWFARERSKVVLTGKCYNPFRDRNPPNT